MKMEDKSPTNENEVIRAYRRQGTTLAVGVRNKSLFCLFVPPFDFFDFFIWKDVKDVSPRQPEKWPNISIVPARNNPVPVWIDSNILLKLRINWSRVGISQNIKVNFASSFL